MIADGLMLVDTFGTGIMDDEKISKAVGLGRPGIHQCVVVVSL